MRNSLLVIIFMGPTMQINKLARRSFFLNSCLVVLLIASNILFFTSNQGEIFNDTCVSVLRTEERISGFHSTETIRLVLNTDNSGYIAFSGNINLHEKVMTLYREFRFTYEKESNGLYRLSNIETVKHSSDNAPDTLIDSVFFSTHHEKARYMTLGKIMNSYIIGNLHSPVFICVVK